jgi:hypothetical protein
LIFSIAPSSVGGIDSTLTTRRRGFFFGLDQRARKDRLIANRRYLKQGNRLKRRIFDPQDRGWLRSDPQGR